MTPVVYREVSCKSALNRVRGMPFEWSLNPYRGCVHACRYCYARAYHARMDRDVGAGFDREVDVKVNFADVLREELRTRRVTGAVALGTATDPYQPCEGKYRLTRRSLEALAGSRLPLSIVTKSTMVVRDIDALRALARRADVTVFFSVPTLDEEVWRTVEPGTPPPTQRLRALARLRAAGLDAGVLCAPVLPGLTDGEASLEAVARGAADAGATFFGWRPLKLDVEIKDFYLDLVATEFPVLLPRYQAVYAKGSHADGAYQRALDDRLERIRARYAFRQRRDRRDAAESQNLPAERQLTLAL